MRYELLLQSKEPGGPWDAANVDRLLTERGARLNLDGSRTWRLRAGDAEVRLLSEGGRPIATEVRVELSDRLELIREVVREGVALAEAAGARLVDPQLAKTLTLSDEARVADQYLRTAQYAGRYAGVSTAVLASYGALESDRGLKPGTKVLLAIVGFLLVLYLIAERLA